MADAAQRPAIHPTEFSSQTPLASVVIACTYDPLGLQGPLNVWLGQLTGLRCTLDWVAYGTVLQTLQDPESAWGTNRSRSGLNVLLLRWQDLDRSCDSGELLVEALRASILRKGVRTLVLLPPIMDTALDAAYDERTAALCSIRGMTLLDTNTLRTALNAATKLNWHSPWLDRVAHAPYSTTANSVFASIVCRELARSCAPRRKVFCLDCDNTLWGGAAGEVGAGAVDLSEEYLNLQRRFVSLQARGALLCLISRNHEADVRAVLAERSSELVLRSEHVAAIRASWDIHKGEAVHELARTLSLDPASFVFVDDSARECAAVHATCAHRGVGVIQLPQVSRLFDAYLEQCWTFDDLSHGADQDAITAEDAQRTTLYRELDERRTFVTTGSHAAGSMHAFAASLGLRIDISPLDGGNARRAAQLTDRTNQHNAFKYSATEAELLHAQASGRVCLVVDARDRFGAHGLVGLIVAEGEVNGSIGLDTGLAESSILHVRAWLLSCRSLYLGIEHSMLRHLAVVAQSRGLTHLGVHWQRAERNEHAAAFFSALPGVIFVPMDDSSGLGLGSIGLSRQLSHRRSIVPAAAKGSPVEWSTSSAESTAGIAETAEVAVRHAIESGRRPSSPCCPPPSRSSSYSPRSGKRLLGV